MQKWAWFFACIVSFVQALGAVSSASEPDSKLKVPSFELTEYSEYLSAETIAGLKKQKQLNDKAFAACNPYEQVSEHDIRECEHRHYEVIMPEAHKTFDVNINDAMISDVPVHIIAPPKSHPMYEANKNRILINLHRCSN